MKKSLKAALSLLLTLVIVFSLAVTAFADGRKITNVPEAYSLVAGTDVFAIYKAILHANGKTENVYYVVCHGLDFTELDPTQPRSYASAIKIGLSNENNAYVKALTAAIVNNVPKDSKLVLVGHSLGGMVIEQAISRKELKKDYEILYSMAIGSPFILTAGVKEGTLWRMVDKTDPVPYLSIPLLANPYLGKAAFETSNYSLLEVHFRSYEDTSLWGKYDCLGYKNGNAWIELNGLVYSY